jgi:phosphoribosylglycinamide formyltransferase 1
MTHTPRPLRAVVLVSGGGSNLERLAADTDHDERAPYRIIGVIANRPDARALHQRQAAHARAVLIDHKTFAEREAFDAALSRQLAAFDAELILLAGFMRILGPALVERWGRQMVNTHPSLLPLFAGLNTHQRALDAAMAVHGATVHRVTAELDGGPILGQVVVPVKAGDDASTLQARVLAGEHRLYPQVARAFAHHLRDAAPLPRLALAYGFD